MKQFIKVLSLTIVLAMTTMILSCYNSKPIYTSSNISTQNIVNVGVLLYSFSDEFSSLLRQNLEMIQKENENKVNYTFFNGEGNPAIQNQLIDNLVENNFDLILINLAEKREHLAEEIIYKIRQKNIPVILFNTDLANINAIKSYNKALIITGDNMQYGTQQGKILADAWNTNKETIDKNGDNILQYVMLQGKINSSAAIARTKYSISTINDAGIKTEQLALIPCNWDKDLAENSIASLFLRYGNKIEAIIANNDSMAIGAINALQKFGYNLGDTEKTIPVVGIDAIPQAQDLIKKGFMLGSVFQDPHALAEALYTVGMNLVSGKNPLEGTNYKFDETGITILLPYKEYTAKSA